MAETIAEELANGIEELLKVTLWDNCASNCISYDDELDSCGNDYFYRTFHFSDGSGIRFEALKSTDTECRPIPGRYMDILLPES